MTYDVTSDVANMLLDKALKHNYVSVKSWYSNTEENKVFSKKYTKNLFYSVLLRILITRGMLRWRSSSFNMCRTKKQLPHADQST